MNTILIAVVSMGAIGVFFCRVFGLCIQEIRH